MTIEADRHLVSALITAQQNALLAEVAAVQITKKPEIIGGFFERRIREVIAEALPDGLAVTPGFIVDRRGSRSSHFDLMIVDTSYPYLGSVDIHKYVMVESVLSVMELSTYLDTEKIEEIFKKHNEVRKICRNTFGNRDKIHFYATVAVSSYGKIAMRQKMISNKFLGDIFILKAGTYAQFGRHCWMEKNASEGPSLSPTARRTETPLSDLLAMIAQDMLYARDDTPIASREIGMRMNDYILWGTLPKQNTKGSKTQNPTKRP
ncbi:DUF6602 domain-containing protein [Rhizobium sp.]|uniref:DUF6602 domain-containing protein n=1 Tax=Rhizobium sp. TaxID=391 RepID=UPI003F7FF92E